MRDTAEWADRAQRDAFARMTPEERLQAGSDMFDFARELARAGVRHAQPHLTDVEVEQRVFERFYRDDFPAERLAHLLERIGRREIGATRRRGGY
jgi:hypothetical protein